MLVNSFLLTKRNGLVRCCSMGAKSIGPSRMCAKIQPHVLSYGSLLVIHVTWPKPNQFSSLPKDQLAEYKISLNWISHNIIIIDVWVTNSVSSIPKFWYIPEQYNRYPKSTWMRTDCQYVLCRIVAMWDFQSPPWMQSAPLLEGGDWKSSITLVQTSWQMRISLLLLIISSLPLELSFSHWGFIYLRIS